MDTAELKRLAAEQGLPAIPVLMPDGDTPRPPRFDGTLDEFWTAAKALGAKAVFLISMQMDETDFERDVPSDEVPSSDDDENDDSFDGDKYTFSLEDAVPAIARYRQHIGKECAFIIIAKGGVAEVDFLLTEKWWDEFQHDADAAVAAWIEAREEKFGEAAAQNEKETGKLLESLRGLINDREFCLLRTHRARIAYAIEKIPELGEVSEFVIKPEIQKLSDRIEVRGLNRKPRK